MERYIRVFLLSILVMFGLINNANASSRMYIVPITSTDFDYIDDYLGSGVAHNTACTGDNYTGYAGHEGMDFVLDVGTPVYAAAAGTVHTEDPENDYEQLCSSTAQNCYGYYMGIDHGSGNWTMYAHLNSYAVADGVYVDQGDLIAYSGQSGPTYPHLHWEVLTGVGSNPVNGNPHNPYYCDDEWFTTSPPTYASGSIPTDAYDAITAKADELYWIGRNEATNPDTVGLIEYEPSGGDMHWYGGDDATDTTFIIEDWDGGTWGSGDDWVAITFDPANTDQDRAYVLRHGFFEIYRTYGGPDMFGAPLGDEMDTTRLEYTPHDSYWGTSKSSAITNNCGSTSQFTSVQRFGSATFCWYEPEWRACLADLEDAGHNASVLPYCYELTDDALHQPAVSATPSSGTTSTSTVTTLDPTTFWYSSLDLTTEGPVDGIDPLTDPHGYVNPITGQYRVTYTGGNGNIYTETNDGAGQVGTWDVMTLSAFAWVPYVRDGISTMPFIDSTTGDETAVFSADDGDIWFMTIDGTTGSITSSSAAGSTGVPYANGSTDPTGYYDPFTGDLQLYFVGTDNHLRQLLRDGVTGSWSSYDFTSVFYGWTLYPGTHPTAFMDPVNGTHYVLFTEADRRVKLLISTDTVTWTAMDLTSLASVDYTVSTPVGFVHPITGAFYVYLMGQNQRVYEIWYNGSWYGNDLSGQASVPYGDYGTSVSAVVNTQTGDILVTFQGDNNRINQFRYRNSAWTATDLTSQISVEYAQSGTTPQTFIDPFTGAETTVFTGSNARIQLIRFGPAFTSSTTVVPTSGPTSTDQYLFIDVNNDGAHDPCVREGSTLYCDQDMDGTHDLTFSIGSSGAEYFSNGTGATVVWPGGDTWYHDTNSDSVTNSTCAYGNGSNETQRLVWRNTILVRWGSALYLDRDLNGVTDSQFSWGAGTETYYLADMDGDGNVDVLKQSGNKFSVNTNSDTVTDWSFYYGASNGSDDYYFADIDGDGADDVLVRRTWVTDNWFLVLYNSSIQRGGTGNTNDYDFTYGP